MYGDALYWLFVSSFLRIKWYVRSGNLTVNYSKVGQERSVGKNNHLGVLPLCPSITRKVTIVS